MHPKRPLQRYDRALGQRLSAAERDAGCVARKAELAVNSRASAAIRGLLLPPVEKARQRDPSNLIFAFISQGRAIPAMSDGRETLYLLGGLISQLHHIAGGDL